MDSSFILLCIALLLSIFLTFYLMTLKNKKVLHYVFLSLTIEIVIWSIALIIESELFANGDPLYMVFEAIDYIGACFAPVSILLIGIFYVNPDKDFSARHVALYIIPIISFLMVSTNEWHHLFYVSFTLEPNGLIVPGAYFYVHVVYSYVCMFVGLGLLFMFAFKKIGKLSPQAFLIIFGTLVPIIVNLLYTFGVTLFNIFSTPTAFAISVLIYVFAISKFKLFKVSPIALQEIVNRISDSYIVIDPEYNIIDYNKTLKDNFSQYSSLQKNTNLYNVIKDSPQLEIDPEKMVKIVNQTVDLQCTMSVEQSFTFNSKEMHFVIEFTPIISRGHCIAIILLLKDVTQHVKDFNTIQENQAILIERQRLASLGQLIGGIAHNLKTPIFSVAGGIEQLLHLSQEYDSSIDDADVTSSDHHEIAQEMILWLSKMKTHMSYMSDIISTVKDQAAQFSIDTQTSFCVDELLKRVDILLHHELTQKQCKLKKNIDIDPQTLILGEVNSLVQVIDNIIINAIQAYDGLEDHCGIIELSVKAVPEGTLFSITDYGKGISQKVQKMLFKEMTTTKGKHGTGLGLYMSYSTIKGMFRGNLWFESQEGVGTTFHLLLPPFSGTRK